MYVVRLYIKFLTINYTTTSPYTDCVASRRCKIIPQIINSSSHHRSHNNTVINECSITSINIRINLYIHKQKYKNIIYITVHKSLVQLHIQIFSVTSQRYEMIPNSWFTSHTKEGTRIQDICNTNSPKQQDKYRYSCIIQLHTILNRIQLHIHIPNKWLL